MIRLKSLEISNYRSCLSTRLDFPQDLMCLIGINGVGKTNILNAIQLLKKLKGNSKFLLGAPKQVTGTITKISGQLLYKTQVINFKCEINYETDDRNNDDVIDADLKFNFKSITDSNKWLELPAELFDYIERIRDQKPAFRRYFKMNLPDLKEIEIIEDIRTFFKKISYYSASQFSDPTKCPISFELDQSRPFRQSRIAAFHEKFLYDLYITSKNNQPLFFKFLNTVDKSGIGIIDTISFAEYEIPSSSYEVKSGGKIRKIERNRQLIIPSFTIDNTELSPNQLSEGTFKTLALVFYIITDENDLLLIEEPEVCVHHGLLNSIISLIETQSTRKQIIISTHSDFVLDKLVPENILIVKREVGEGTKAKALTKSLSKNEYKALKTYLSEAGNLGEYWKEGGFDND